MPVDLEGIQKQVENIRKTLGDLKTIQDQLNTSRGVVCSLVNATDLSLSLAFDAHESGGFSDKHPPRTVEPQSGVTWGSKSRAGAIGTGTIGSVHYKADELLVKCDWNVPWALDNSSSMDVDSTTGRYRSYNTTGVGDHAHMQFNVFGIPEQGGWRSCGACHTLFFDAWPDNKGHCAKRTRMNPLTSGGGVLQTTVDRTSTTGAITSAKGGVSTTIDGGISGGGSQRVAQARSGHKAAGHEYLLSHDWEPTANQHTPWRACARCNVLFWDGWDAKGVCADGAPHQSKDSFDYLVPFEDGSALPRTQQAGWRTCERCLSLFFEPADGDCPAQKDGGKHEAGTSAKYALNFRA